MNNIEMEKSNIYVVLNENDVDDILIKNADTLIIILHISKKEDAYINMRRQYIEISRVLQNEIFLFVDVNEFKNTIGKYTKNIDMPLVEFYFNKAMIAYTAGFNKEMIMKSVFSLKTKLNELKQKLYGGGNKNTVHNSMEYDTYANKQMIDPNINQKCTFSDREIYIKKMANMNSGNEQNISHEIQLNGNNAMQQIIGLYVPHNEVQKNNANMAKQFMGLHVSQDEIKNNVMQHMCVSEYDLNNNTNQTNTKSDKICAIMIDPSNYENEMDKPIIKMVEKMSSMPMEKNKTINNSKIVEIEDEHINNDEKSELMDNLKKIYVLQQLQKIKEAEES